MSSTPPKVLQRGREDGLGARPWHRRRFSMVSAWTAINLIGCGKKMGWNSQLGGRKAH